MTVIRHKRYILLSLNFAFVSWGIVFLLGVLHGVYRAEIQDTIWLKMIFVSVSLLHFIALTLLLSALYNLGAYVVRLISANKRARTRIEALRIDGQKITPQLIASIRK